MAIAAGLEAALTAMDGPERRSAISALAAFGNCPNPTYTADLAGLLYITAHGGWAISVTSPDTGVVAAMNMSRLRPGTSDGGDQAPTPTDPPPGPGPRALPVELTRALSHIQAFSHCARLLRHADAPAAGILDDISFLLALCVETIAAEHAGAAPSPWAPRITAEVQFPLAEGGCRKQLAFDPATERFHVLNRRVIHVFVGAQSPLRITALPLAHTTYILVDDKALVVPGSTFIDLSYDLESAADRLLAVARLLAAGGQRLFRFDTARAGEFDW